MKKIQVMGICLLLMLCGLAGSADIQAKIKVKRITVKSNFGKIVHVGTGKKVSLKTTVTTSPDRKSWKGVRYKSKNKGIATVNSIGQIKGKRQGTTRIYAISKKNKKKRVSIMVKVVKPLKKILLKETSITLKVGGSALIKKSVVPSDSGFKRLLWCSSKPSVAKVNSEGKVTALTPGTVDITAKAVDGSGTKAVCSVKVEAVDTINLAEVKPLSNNTVRVRFDAPVPLELSAFQVTGRNTASGTYNKQYQLSRMRNYGNTTYDLRIQEGMSLEKHSSVRVSIQGLPGNGVKLMESEVEFIKTGSPTKQCVDGKIQEYVHATVDLSDYGAGALVYQVGSLPEGISYKIMDNEIRFFGKTNQTYFGKQTKISAIDEKENQIQTSVYWYIGSEDKIVGYADSLVLVTEEEVGDDKGSLIHVVGGSGSYEYTFTNLPQGLLGDGKTGEISGAATAAGDAKVRVEIQDVQEPTRKIAVSLNVHVEPGSTLSGVVKDSQGNVMSGVSIRFTTTDDSRVYKTKTGTDGSYRIRVVNDTYNGLASIHVGDTVQDDIYESIVKGNRQIDFSPSCWRVQIEYDKERYELKESLWKSYADDGVTYEGDEVLYVRPGRYELYTMVTKKEAEEQIPKEQTPGEQIPEYPLRVTFAITDTSVQAKAELVEQESEDDKDKEEESHAE